MSIRTSLCSKETTFLLRTISFQLVSIARKLFSNLFDEAYKSLTGEQLKIFQGKMSNLRPKKNYK